MSNTNYTNAVEFCCLEQLKETSLDLFLEHCGREACRPEHLCSRLRQEYILHFIFAGKGSVTAEGQTWSLSAGEMFLIRPQKPLTYVSDHEDPWVYGWVGFSGLQTDHILSRCGFGKHIVVQSFDNMENIQMRLNNILDAHELTFSNDLRRKSELQMLFADLIDDFEKRNKIQRSQTIYYGNNVYLEQAIGYIKRCCSQGINVTDIAKEIGLSRAYLNQVFQKELGISVQKFLIDYRLHKAANCLVNNGTVREAASKVGYDDPLAFSKAFKKKFGVSPSTYRTQQETMHDPMNHFDPNPTEENK